MITALGTVERVPFWLRCNVLDISIAESILTNGSTAFTIQSCSRAVANPGLHPADAQRPQTSI
eukprot:5169759-Pleurochrysis_carterae.AAC.2